MRKGMRMAAAWAVASIAGIGTARAFTDPILVDSDAKSPHWSTVFTNAVSLQWDWAANVVHAEMGIQGMNSAWTTNFTEVTSNYLWRVSASPVPLSEDVYGLVLTFYGDGEAVVGALTSQVAVVTGAFGAVEVKSATESETWSKIRGNVVIPYDAAWPEAAATNALSAQLVIDNGGQSRTNAFAEVAGYYGLKIKNNGWGYGEFSVWLSFPGTDGLLTATLFRPLDGTWVGVR